MASFFRNPFKRRTPQSAAAAIPIATPVDVRALDEEIRQCRARCKELQKQRKEIDKLCTQGGDCSFFPVPGQDGKFVQRNKAKMFDGKMATMYRTEKCEKCGKQRYVDMEYYMGGGKRKSKKRKTKRRRRRKKTKKRRRKKKTKRRK